MVGRVRVKGVVSSVWLVGEGAAHQLRESLRDR
jgi:hypothetical protein